MSLQNITYIQNSGFPSLIGDVAVNPVTTTIQTFRLEGSSGMKYDIMMFIQYEKIFVKNLDSLNKTLFHYVPEPKTKRFFQML